MKIIYKQNKLKRLIKDNKSLGFVPTMGGIHKGHISLINKSINQCNKTIVSIFVNKPQFNKKRDFINYPRVLDKDISTLKKKKIDFLYLPNMKEIYPRGPNKKIKIISFKKKLCGKFRPGHFEAIVDVINRFLNIINPRRIYLGQKDYQQLKIIENFVNKKHTKIIVVGCKIIREKNGVACSTRNFLLSNNDMQIASKIYKFIHKNKKNITSKKISLKRVKDKFKNFGVSKIDYIEFLDINRIAKPYKNKKKYRIFIAYFIKSIRLIDNI